MDGCESKNRFCKQELLSKAGPCSLRTPLGPFHRGPRPPPPNPVERRDSHRICHHYRHSLHHCHHSADKSSSSVLVLVLGHTPLLVPPTVSGKFHDAPLVPARATGAELPKQGTASASSSSSGSPSPQSSGPTITGLAPP